MPEHNNAVDDYSLRAIVGAKLSSVEFVMDYLQLRFDGPYLTCVTQPEIRQGGVCHNWNDPRYCTVLRQCITKKVIGAYVIEREEICVSLVGGVDIVISLRDEDYRAAEAVVFQSGGPEWMVW